MPDPQKTLAPIIEPLAPPLLPQAAPAWPEVLLTGLIVVLFIALAFWLWRRGAALRALHRIARVSDARAGADQLADWVRACKIQPAPEWQAALERLRFGPPQPEMHQALVHLCREASLFFHNLKRIEAPSPALPRTPPPLAGEGLGEREVSASKPDWHDR
jgi:hypothetical protein